MRRNPDTVARNKAIAREWYATVMAEAECEECGKRPRTLHWHHRRGFRTKGDKGVSSLVANGYSIARIQKEIAKCEALCRSCHMKRHQQSRVSSQQRRHMQNLYMTGAPMRTIATRFNISLTQTWRLLHGRTSGHRPSAPVDWGQP